MRSLIWLFFSPFAMVGGLLVGWYSHVLVTAEIAADTSLLGLGLTTPGLLIGIGLIILGWVVRAWIMKRMRSQMVKQEAALASDQSIQNGLQKGLALAERRLQIVRDLIDTLPASKQKFLMGETDEEM